MTSLPNSPELLQVLDDQGIPFDIDKANDQVVIPQDLTTGEVIDLWMATEKLRHR